MTPNTITILHPFTPQAAGVVEKSVATYHSQPHLKALVSLAETEGWRCGMEYFTHKLCSYRYNIAQVAYRFYPVDFTWNGDHKKWKKQTSKKCLKAYKKETPDVTILNMSGHSSPFSYQLSKVILDKGKEYIAMLGGRHYTDSIWVREYYKRAHHILVHTQLQKQEMLGMPMFQDLDIRVFPLGIDTHLFKPEVKPHSATINLLYVGRITNSKRIHLAIEIVAFLKQQGQQAVLKIVGPISSPVYKKELDVLIVQNQLEKEVTFEGIKPHHDLPYYFQQADLFLLPSSSESFGMVVAESMACGTPVAVIKGVNGPEEIITHNVDGIITSKEKYVSEVANLLQNKEKLQSMGLKARNKTMDKYSIQETSKVLLQSVKSALFNA